MTKPEEFIERWYEVLDGDTNMSKDEMLSDLLSLLSEAVREEREKSRYIRSAVQNLIEALRTNDPVLHARAIAIGKKALELEDDIDAYYGRTPEEK